MTDKNDERRMIRSNRAAFLAAGFGLAAWAPMIPYVQERFALNEQELGLLLLCIGLGSLCAMPIAGWAAGRFGCRILVYISMLFVSLGLCAITLIHHLYVMGVVLVIFGMAAVMLDVVSNINAARVELITGRGIMSGLHGLYSVGGFLGSLGVTALLTLGVSLPAAGTTAAVLLFLVVVSGCRDLLDAKSGRTETEKEQGAADDGNARVRVLHPLVLLVGILCFIMFMTEGSMLDWSGIFLRTERGVPVEQAGLGYAAFAIAMTLFRLTGDKIVATLGRRRVLVSGTGCIAAGYVLAVTVPHPYMALLGFFLIGVGASNVVPQLISYTVTIEGTSINAAVTIVNAIGFTGILCGPALIGFLAHLLGLHNVFLLQACAVLCVGACCFVLLRRKKPSAPAAVKSASAADGKGK
ncbi:MAG: MFS transporter [Proteobacteria bacterium]|uniref:MFS transporter n=1 Tax=Candidatus Avisuccinivibrio stercorigallinarum TaxID=2840704 RepID=A0A9D9GTA8_9GAMM|nr:MFS transporter [Candidatus Avisuccinivibrio stercorigallinarum]